MTKDSVDEQFRYHVEIMEFSAKMELFGYFCEKKYHIKQIESGGTIKHTICRVTVFSHMGG